VVELFQSRGCCDQKGEYAEMSNRVVAKTILTSQHSTTLSKVPPHPVDALTAHVPPIKTITNKQSQQRTTRKINRNQKGN
jgi:hypothetical protein